MGVFKFKRFSVCDDGAAMKVGTDAVLLGAWTNVESANQILDVGSGSGIIALMLAQRSGSNAHIDAVELLSEDSRQAEKNIRQSPWPSKVSVFNTTIQKFSPGIKYDCLVCNPPYFINSLLPPLETRRTARHDITLSLDELLDAAERLLNASGSLNLILPCPESDKLISIASRRKLYLHRHTRFFTRMGKAAERSLMEFRFTAGSIHEDSIVLYQTELQWTDSYINLTKDFYLDR